MKKLYVTQDNAMNYLVIEDFETDLAYVVDFDLSEEEVKKAAKAFEAGQYTSPLEIAENSKEDAETVLARYNSRKILAIAD